MAFTVNPEESIRSMTRSEVERISRETISDCIRELYFKKIDDSSDGFDMTSKQLDTIQNGVHLCSSWSIDLDDPYKVVNRLHGVAIGFRTNEEFDSMAANLIDRFADKAAEKITAVMDNLKERELYFATLKQA